MNLLLFLLFVSQFYRINCDEEISDINNSISKKNQETIILNLCVDRLTEFSEYHKNFIQCVIEYGQPIKICENCLDKFAESNIYYKRLIEPYNGTNCHDQFIDKDRINIVTTLYNNGVNIWNKAYCKDCYDWHDNTLQLNFSMETQNILNHLNGTNTCIANNLGDPCGPCSDQYVMLNNLFVSMEKLKKSEICFDLQDAINKTRLLWSKEMKCCDERDSSLLSFTILSSTFSIIIIMFYIVVPYLEIKTQSRAMPLNPDEEESEQNRSLDDSNIETSGNIIIGFVMPSDSANN